MTTLTAHGGTGEIGGNAFLLEDSGTRIFLDFGKRFGNDQLVETAGLRPGFNDYFDEYLKPRPHHYVPDLLALGLTPNVPGIYRHDLGGDQKPTDLDGIVLSHAHSDHAGIIGLLRPEIPVFTSQESMATLGSIQATGRSMPETDFLYTKVKGVCVETKTGLLTTRTNQAPAGPERAFHAGTHFDVGAFDVEQFAVDHSIHGARGTVLSGPNGTIAYTGDFRLHGRNGDASKRFVERAGQVDVLICEGTRVSGKDHQHSDSMTEDEVAVEGEIQEAVQTAGDNIAVIAYPPRDLDRFQSIYNVARRLGRRLTITTKQAHLLASMRAAGRLDLPDPLTDTSLAIHITAKGKGLILQDHEAVTVGNPDLSVQTRSVDVGEYEKVLKQDYQGWEQPYLEAATAVTSRDIQAEARGYLVTMTYYSITQLFELFPHGAPRGGVYVHSMTQPFNDEMAIMDRKLLRWLSHFGLKRVDTHVSGHISEENLHWVLDEIGAKTLVPIHSIHPGITGDKYAARTGFKVVIPEPLKPLQL